MQHEDYVKGVYAASSSQKPRTENDDGRSRPSRIHGYA